MSEPCHGKIQKVTLVVVLLSLFGWLTFVTFFGLTTQDQVISARKESSRLSVYAIPYWSYLILGALFHIAVIMNITINGRYFLQPIINIILGLVFISGGAIIYTDLLMYFSIFPRALYLVELSSCLFSLISLLMYLAVVPFTNRKTSDIAQNEVSVNEYTVAMDMVPQNSTAEAVTISHQEDYEPLSEVQMSNLTPTANINETMKDTEQEDYEAIQDIRIPISIDQNSEEYASMHGGSIISEETELHNQRGNNDDNMYEYLPET